MDELEKIYVTINELSKKVNNIQSMIDVYFGYRCDVNEESIEITDGGLIDVADVLSSHDEAITELASIVSSLSDESSEEESEVL